MLTIDQLTNNFNVISFLIKKKKEEEEEEEEELVEGGGKGRGGGGRGGWPDARQISYANKV